MERTPESADELRDLIVSLRDARRQRKHEHRGKPRRRTLASRRQRELVLAKTAGRCHLCGGKIGDERWHADHVLAHSGGGEHHVDNYLPAHATCNGYKWDYMPEEFQVVLKLGVFVKTLIEGPGTLGRAVAESFVRYESRRVKRRRR